MKFIADFHIHSKFSHATSKFMDLQALAIWGQLKGIAVMGTGDFTHPEWQKELKQQLQEAEPGLFELKQQYYQHVDRQVYSSCKHLQRFLLSSEVSLIFKRNGRCYKAHVIILAPSFDVVEKISAKLAKIGNIVADGRPILGLDVKDLLKIVLDVSLDCMVIPAHIWTPWFGMLGSKSGFDSVEQCFEELTPHIYALETGLSSNFLMNAQLSELDKYTLLCNSDAHSVQKLGREANFMHAELSYFDIVRVLKQNDPKGLIAGVEFFPERGKYYGDGHRACNVHLTPEQTQNHNLLCPSCQRSLTVGVRHRVQQLADRTEVQAVEFKRKAYRVVPLLDIISQCLGVAETSKKVQNMYHSLLRAVGSEFFILLKAPLVQIEQASTSKIAQAIGKLRVGDVVVRPGYDGVYGQIQF